MFTESPGSHGEVFVVNAFSKFLTDTESAFAVLRMKQAYKGTSKLVPVICGVG